MSILAALALLPACTLTPSGADEELARVNKAGSPYEAPIDQRVLPELPPAPGWRDILQRALLANGDLEAAYFDWKASVQRIEIASAYPNSNLSLGYSYMFSSEKMKSFDRQTFSLGFDSSMTLSFPTKVQQQGKVALDEARVAAERFRTAKFDVQRRVLTAWAEYGMLAAKREIQGRQLSLAHLAADATRARAQSAGVQRELLRSETAQRLLEDALRTTETELAATRVMLNAMLARPPEAPLQPPTLEAIARDNPAGDDAILAAAAERNPELGALAQQVQGRADALELARMQWIPDISPAFSFTGAISQSVGAAVMLPTTVVQIRGSIAEAESMLRGSEASLRQARRDRGSTVVATLLAMHNSERQAKLFEDSLLPLADRLQETTRRQYTLGAAMYTDLVEAQAMALESRMTIVEARAAREKRLAELEALIGADIETLGSPANQAHRHETVGDLSRARITTDDRRLEANHDR